MNGLELVLALFMVGVAVWCVPVAEGVVAAICLGGGASAMVWGFAFGWWPLAIGGLVLLGAGTFLHERAVWARHHRASEALEAERVVHGPETARSASSARRRRGDVP